MEGPWTRLGSKYPDNQFTDKRVSVVIPVPLCVLIIEVELRKGEFKGKAY